MFIINPNLLLFFFKCYFVVKSFISGCKTVYVLPIIWFVLLSTSDDWWCSQNSWGMEITSYNGCQLLLFGIISWSSCCIYYFLANSANWYWVVWLPLHSKFPIFPCTSPNLSKRNVFWALLFYGYNEFSPIFSQNPKHFQF